MRLLFDMAVRVSGEPRRCGPRRIWRVQAICGRPLCRMTNRIYLSFARVAERYRWTGFVEIDRIPILTDLLAARPAVIAFADRLEPRIRAARENLEQPVAVLLR